MLLHQFPGVITAKPFGYKSRASFSMKDEMAISTAPKVDFGNP